MFSRIFKQIFLHKLIAVITLLFVALGVYFGYGVLTGDKNAVRYVAAAVEKDTLIVSVSGSGQVTILDQIDIKPKTSGEIAFLYVKKEQEVKTGQLLAELDPRSSQQAIRDAEVALGSAKVKFEKLLSQPDAESLLQAENALAQAGRDLDKVKENYEEIEIDAERSLAMAYEDGYSSVSTTFFKLSDYMEDLKDVLGTEQRQEKHISAYKIVLGSESLFIQKFLDDYRKANNLFNANFTFFRGVYRDDDRNNVYQLIGETLETTKAVSLALESARHMFDAISVGTYQYLDIASHIDKMQPKIESDVSAVYSNISSLQRIKDTIDDTNKDTPKEIEDAQLAIQSAQEKFDEKKLALEEIMAGASAQDIKSEENIVAQKEDALLDVKEKLANCFIRAPFDGIIAEIKIEKGDSVSTGTALVNIISQQKIAEITLNEVDAAKIKVGQKAILVLDALPDVSISGRVLEIDASGTVNQGVVSYGVKITFDSEEEQIKPGMSITADIIIDVKQDVLALPNNAIKSQGDSYYVELVEVGDNEFRQQLLASVSGIILPKSPSMQLVEIGLSNDLSTEIVSGLKEGDIVVASTINSNNIQAAQTQNGAQTQGFQMPGTSGQSMPRMRDFR